MDKLTKLKIQAVHHNNKRITAVYDFIDIALQSDVRLISEAKRAYDVMLWAKRAIDHQTTLLYRMYRLSPDVSECSVYASLEKERDTAIKSYNRVALELDKRFRKHPPRFSGVRMEDDHRRYGIPKAKWNKKEDELKIALNVSIHSLDSIDPSYPALQCWFAAQIRYYELTESGWEPSAEIQMLFNEARDLATQFIEVSGSSEL